MALSTVAVPAIVAFAGIDIVTAAVAVPGSIDKRVPQPNCGPEPVICRVHEDAGAVQGHIESEFVLRRIGFRRGLILL